MPLPDVTRSWAVLVGAGKFAEDSSLPPIPAIGGNLTDMAAALTDPRLLGLPPDQCQVILNPAAPQDITRPILRLGDKVQDTLIIYYAGHGLVDDHDSTLILATATTAARDARFSGLSYELLRNAIGSVQARCVIVVLDCCFSGRAITAMGDTDSVIIGQLDIEGSYILASSPATKPSIAPAGARHTAFTGGLLDILYKGVPGGSRFLRLPEIYQRLLAAMIRAGYPRPRQQDVNNIGSLDFVRNIAWQSTPKVSVPSRSLSRAKAAQLTAVSAGMSVAVAAVSEGFGPGNGDSMTALEGVQSVSGEHRRGFEMMCQLASSMRRQFGDGAATAMIMAGHLAEGIATAASAGSDSEALSDCLECAVDETCDRMAALAEPCTDVAVPLRVAFGDCEVVDLVADAASSVGAGNVETIERSAGSADLEITSRVTLTTSIVSPNAVATPISMIDPYVVISPDVELDDKAFRAISGRLRPSLLLITPHRTVLGLRAILHTFRRIVVVRAVVASEWSHLGAILELLLGCPPQAGTAMRALITDSSTTIIGKGDLRVGDTGRAHVFVGHDGGRDPELARRALLVARAAEAGGVLAGGGAALYQAGRTISSRSAEYTAGRGRDAASLLLSAAMCEPLRQLARNAGRDPASVSGELATLPEGYGLDLSSGQVADLIGMNIVDAAPVVGGALRHALATVVSLTEEG